MNCRSLLFLLPWLGVSGPAFVGGVEEGTVTDPFPTQQNWKLLNNFFKDIRNHLVMQFCERPGKVPIDMTIKILTKSEGDVIIHNCKL